MSGDDEVPPVGRVPELRTLAMPADTNPGGDIFGGWLLAQMDLAAGTFAGRLARGRVATVGVEAMSFHRPVYVGDVISCYCELHRRGRTSLTVQIHTWALRRREGHSERLRVTEALFTFVAIDGEGCKRTLPAELDLDPS